MLPGEVVPEAEIVAGHEKHERDDCDKADPEADFLNLLAKRPPAQRLEREEQKVPAIQDRNREQIDQPNADRKQSGKIDQRHEAERCHLSGDLGNADRTAELVGRFAAGYHAEIDAWASDITDSLARRGPAPPAAVTANCGRRS